MKVSAPIWSVIQVIGKQGVSVLTFFFLSFFLNPQEFGVISMAMSWILFLMVFSEIGFGAAIIQKKNIDNNHLSTIFVMNLFAGAGLMLVGICVAPWAALFFKTPEVKPVLAVLSIGFMVNSLSLTQMALAQREMRFRDLAIRDLISSTIGGLIGLGLAIMGYGVWSLVAQTLVSYSLASFLIFRISDWNPNFRLFKVSYLKELWPYSSKIFYFNVLKYFTQNVDKLLIGYILGPIALGIYVFAYKLTIYPVSMASGAVGNYLFPKFSKHQADMVFLKEHFVFINKIMNTLIIPPMLVWLVSSKDILQSFIDGKWVDASIIVKFLALVGIVQIFFPPVGHLMKAINKPDLLFKWSIFFSTVTIICLYFGVNNTIVSVGISLLIAHLIGFFWLVYIVNKLIDINYISFKAMYKSVIIASLIMVSSYYVFVNIFIEKYHLIGILFSIFMYFITYAILEKTFCINLLNKIRSTKN